MKIHCNYHQNKLSRGSFLVSVTTSLMLSLYSLSSVQANNSFVRAAASEGRLVQIVDLSRLNNPHGGRSGLASPDPSGITYFPKTDSVLIVDGEVEEKRTGAPSRKYNVFEVNYDRNVSDIKRLRDVFTFWDKKSNSAAFSYEPTGISAINPRNGHIFVSDDDSASRISKGPSIFEVDPRADGYYGTDDDRVTRTLLTKLKRGGIKDPEGVAFGIVQGQEYIFIAGGIDHEVYIVNLGKNGILDDTDTVRQFDTSRNRLYDPEGIEFDPYSEHLYVIGNPIDQVFEYKVDGTLVKTIDISAALPKAPGVPSGLGLKKPAGLILAPSSVDDKQWNLYIVDRGIDNDRHPNENDGQMFEIDILGNSRNRNPIPVNDSVTTQRDTAVNGNVLDGSLSAGRVDRDPDGDKIRAVLNTSPSNGRLAAGIGTNGRFTYTPKRDYTGSDSFKYTITDGRGGRATAKVNITVKRSPIVVDDGGNRHVISSRVATSSDDAEEKNSTGSMTTTSGDLDLTVSGGSQQSTGVRFRPAIPAGATILNAYIQFTADEALSSSTSLTIKGQKSGNAPTFTSANGNISGRATTRSSVSWSAVPSWKKVGDAGSAQRTPNLSSIVQEIVNGAGWSSGNGLAVIITGTGKRPAETYDANPAKAAILHVEYSTGSSGGNQDPVVVDDGGNRQVISSRVATSSDDAEEKDSTGSVTTTSGDLDLTVSGGSTQTIGMRFHPAIPTGATIVNAYIQFTADEVHTTATSLKIKGQKSGNAPTFTSANRNISGRATTGSSVTWRSVPSWNKVGDAGSAQRTPNLNSIIQEIVNGSGWSSGNGLAIIITGAGKRPAETYDADPAKAAVLHVEYRK